MCVVGSPPTNAMGHGPVPPKGGGTKSRLRRHVGGRGRFSSGLPDDKSSYVRACVRTCVRAGAILSTHTPAQAGYLFIFRVCANFVVLLRRASPDEIALLRTCGGFAPLVLEQR